MYANVARENSLVAAAGAGNTDTAETLSPSKAQGIISGMYGPMATNDCRTAKKKVAI